MTQKESVFTQGSLMRHVSVMSFTSSIGLMAIFAVDLIDMIFIAMLGKEALAAAVGYAGILLFFTNSINIGMSIAAGALTSRAIGAGEKQKAREYASSVAVFAAIIGVILPAIVLFNLSTLLFFLGAEGEIARQASLYLWIVMPSMPAMGIAMTGIATLRAHGDAKRPMFATLSGGIVNAALDPLFIFVFDLDLQGAALASLIARFVILGVALYPAVKYYGAFSVPAFSIISRHYATVFQIAVPAALTNIATPVGSAIVMQEISRYGTEAVAGMAIIGRLTPVAFAVVLALSGAIGPIIGQNYGAGLTERVKGTFVDGLKFLAIYVLAATALLFWLRTSIADLFDATSLTRSLIYLFCGPLALASFFNGAIFIANASFNNLGRPIYSTWINWGKNTLGTWPFVLMGGTLWGAQGVFMGQALGSVVFAGLAIFLALGVIDNPVKKPPVSDTFQKQKRLHLLCGRGRW